MFSEVIHGMNCADVRISVSQLSTLADMEPAALRTELQGYAHI